MLCRRGTALAAEALDSQHEKRPGEEKCEERHRRGKQQDRGSQSHSHGRSRSYRKSGGAHRLRIRAAAAGHQIVACCPGASLSTSGP